jgi:hypothetical protein
VRTPWTDSQALRGIETPKPKTATKEGRVRTPWTDSQALRGIETGKPRSQPPRREEETAAATNQRIKICLYLSETEPMKETTMRRTDP